MFTINGAAYRENAAENANRTYRQSRPSTAGDSPAGAAGMTVLNTSWP